jgi:hypothetical protein
MANEMLYAEYAAYFFATTGCQPMTFAEWLAAQAPLTSR